MQTLWRLMGEYNAETKTFTALAGTAQTSPYSTDFNGRLVAVRLIPGGDAASTLMEHVQIKMTCTLFVPNEIHFGISGGGLRTAPAFQPNVVDYQVNQKVRADIPINIEGRNITADTPVGVVLLVYGLFQVEGV